MKEVVHVINTEAWSSEEKKSFLEMELAENRQLSIMKTQKEEGLKEGKEEGFKEGKEEGLKEGKEEGLKEGKEEGLKEAAREFVKRLNAKKTPVEEIIQLTGFTEEQINEILSAP